MLVLINTKIRQTDISCVKGYKYTKTGELSSQTHLVHPSFGTRLSQCVFEAQSATRLTDANISFGMYIYKTFHATKLT